ncbi:MAG TPA: nucleotidyltransferase domain-containing protein [Candidatus Woesebacteria bacterium]|jgi:hypothetical protein|nr:nucleotidyltransferase domain-containing protein [Candidatus Shapirobacteria bacterium]HOR01939.1 nucleotidyltransferase domain-containing protein [Candidatus Woesebacteria bacterium]
MRVETAVKKTIDYAAGFGSHINRKEIGQRLLSAEKFSKKEIDQVLKKIGWVNKKNKWYQDKVEVAKKMAQKIEDEFGEIYFLGISGSVASGHPKKEDDIDMLIITKNNKLWKNRFKLRWWMKKNRLPYRDRLGKRKENCFCFNLWLDESGLKMPLKKQNLRNAIDLILLKPLINKYYVYERFLKENGWVRKYSAPGYDRLIKKNKLNKIKIKKSKGGVLGNIIYFWPQYWYMKPKITNEKVGLHQAFFHKSDGKIES